MTVCNKPVAYPLSAIQVKLGLAQRNALRIDFDTNPALHTADQLTAHQRRFLKRLYPHHRAAHADDLRHRSTQCRTKATMALIQCTRWSMRRPRTCRFTRLSTFERSHLKQLLI